MYKHPISQTNLGERIRIIRKNNHYTQAQFSEALGISAKFLSAVENGKKGISAKTLCVLCTRFQVSADYLLLGKETSKYEILEISLKNSEDFSTDELELLIGLATSILNLKK